MGDFVPTSRSNYFSVVDEDVFRKAMDALDVTYQMGQDGLYMIYPEMGDWPDTNDNDVEVDFVKVLQRYLSPGDVCILHTVGYEKLRYLNHGMVAFTREGVVLHHSQENFYDELNRLGYKFTRAES